VSQMPYAPVRSDRKLVSGPNISDYANMLIRPFGMILSMWHINWWRALWNLILFRNLRTLIVQLHQSNYFKVIPYRL
jgi:hypothetical protein